MFRLGSALVLEQFPSHGSKADPEKSFLIKHLGGREWL